MLTVRNIPLPQDARNALDAMIAASQPAPAGLWSRIKAAAALDRKFLAERAAQARNALLRGTCTEVEVDHDTPPGLAEHEHGLFLFVPARPDATFGPGHRQQVVAGEQLGAGHDHQDEAQGEREAGRQANDAVGCDTGHPGDGCG